ncbi:unnamed protein product [Parascedosporium putredinis]|uniref:Phosphatidate phosphatase APP1 catalytic domain-containing protein n=1 Tax=Parascedosporium putredinis TaxID=1442378 RepID=A0A9P1MCP3_9PEZI|nr:unnamed protein product [Parascedosporium putredinis]CAI8001054.1 unnamed protein product [Parascedosporium putredinis]
MRRELLRYLFPSALRTRYQERVLLFHLDTLPKFKHRAQSRIHNFLLSRYRRRLDGKPGVLDLVRRQGARFAFAPRRAAKPRGVGHIGQDKMLPASSSAGASAVSEIRESYAQTRTAAFDPFEHERQSIPGAFPDARVTVQGTDQMILFPTYAKRHVKTDLHSPRHRLLMGRRGMRDDDYWDTGWEREWDKDAIVDVDVRGWLYSPHKGPLTRKNRIMLGLARQLSGIPRIDAQQGGGAAGDDSGALASHEDLRVQEKIALEAAKIEQRGQEEGKAASQGQYTEDPDKPYRPGPNSLGGNSRSTTPVGLAPPQRPATASSAGMDLTEAELATANINLAARIAPFLTVPFTQIPITIFFYNESCSQSRTVMTNASGQFNIRAALPFVPTHVRVLANERLSTIQEVQVTESAGVSVISDIDDTIKRSNISAGAREIFRNTFIRDLPGLTVDGVREWYNKMHAMGVGIHYCSNSPWQLFPVLATFFKISGLPPGSMHLKAYNGMLQGIFEPVAERKKPTLERILADFPERKFILVGDSGEADLEVYTELAVAHPGRVLAIFIRDVTTPDHPDFFDSSIAAGILRAEKDKLKAKPGPSPRPAKPAALRSGSSESRASTLQEDSSQTSKRSSPAPPPPPPRSRKPVGAPSDGNPRHPFLSRNIRTTLRLGQGIDSIRETRKERLMALTGPQRDKRLLPPPRRTGTGSSVQSIRAGPDYITPRDNRTPPASTPRMSGTPPNGPAATASEWNSQGQQQGNATVNKKLELWRRRLARAQEILDDQGVQLYTWKRGYDVMDEATGIIRRALEEGRSKPRSR